MKRTSSKRNFIKRQFIAFILGVALIGGVSACSNQEKGKTINVYNWGDYIAPETIENFTKETGIKVNYELFDSNEIMYAKYKSGAVNYDVLVPSDYMIEKLIKEDELLALDYDNIPNAQYIGEDFKKLAYDVDNKYSVPYMWGTLGILYNSDMVKEPVDSWDILFDPKYKGQILMQNSVRDTFAVALKKLGYSVNTTDKKEIDQAFALIQEQSELVQGYVIDKVKDKMIGNEAALALIYSGEAIFTKEYNEAMEYSVPKEGSNLWVDGIVIPKTAKNKKEAEMFINYLCDPQVAYNNSDYIGYSTPNQKAKEMFPEEIINNKSVYPDQEVIDNCEVYIDLGPEITQYYNDKWNELKASLN